MHNSEEPGDMRLWAPADERARDSFQHVYSAVSFKPVLKQLQLQLTIIFITDQSTNFYFLWLSDQSINL